MSLDYNYRHLYYFWVVAQEGGMTRGAEFDTAELHHEKIPTTQTMLTKHLLKTLGNAPGGLHQITTRMDARAQSMEHITILSVGEAEGLSHVGERLQKKSAQELLFLTTFEHRAEIIQNARGIVRGEPMEHEFLHDRFLAVHHALCADA